MPTETTNFPMHINGDLIEGGQFIYVCENCGMLTGRMYDCLCSEFPREEIIYAD